MTVLLALLVAGLAHPKHTSVAELRWDPVTGVVRAAIRVYPDDLAGALPAGEAPADGALCRYARDHFLLVDREGRPIALEAEGLDHSDGAVVIRLRGHATGGTAGMQVGHHLLHDRFEDQINVVRVHQGGRTSTLLFVPGDGLKALP